MRAFLSLAFTVALLAAFAQPGPRPITHRATCDPISPYSVDITGDRVANHGICGQC